MHNKSLEKLRGKACGLPRVSAPTLVAPLNSEMGEINIHENKNNNHSCHFFIVKLHQYVDFLD